MFAKFLGSALVILIVGSGVAAEPSGRFEFTRMVAHWSNYHQQDYLDFIEQAQPDLAQVGFYGAHFWSLVHTPQYSGYPSHFPVRGLQECGNWFQQRNHALHQRGVKVVGHFNIEFLVGDPDSDEGPRGFFHFYRDLWDEQQLGPKPVSDPLDFLEKDVQGKPIVSNQYRLGGMREYWACLRNPNWQKVLQAWVKHGVERGLDGFIVNYFYRHNCHCDHCQHGFRRYLSGRFTPHELQDRFAIRDLKDHRFDELVAWHSPEDSTPLRREMLRWSQISNKRVFDKIFVRFGRSLKSDLIVAQWNHLGNLSQISGDERCLLPAEHWGSDEDYLWYSTGASANYTDLQNRYLGEGTLQARYIRGSFDDKPFTLGKYEHTRIRTAIAELSANGGAPMGFYTRFGNPAAREVIVRYYQFLKRFDEVYRGNRSHAEAVLLFPRRAVHAGNLAPMQAFRELGTKLLDEHILFDVLPDDVSNPRKLAAYRRVFTTNDAAGNLHLSKASFSQFDAPYTVRVSASRPAKGTDVAIHFVNYNREEPSPNNNGQPSTGGGITDEKPLAVKTIHTNFILPVGMAVETVEMLTPTSDESLNLPFTQIDNRITFDLSEFSVYCLVRIRSK